MKKIFTTLFFTVILCNFIFAQDAASLEAQGIDIPGSAVKVNIPFNNTFISFDSIPPGGLILIPESTGDLVMAFDPVTGDLINDSLIVDDDVNDFFATPIQAIQNPTKDRLYVSDQVKDLVQEFDNDGNYLGIFAPAGGQNTAYADNIRGLCLKHGTDHILVADGNNDAIQEFDGSGNYVGTFGPQGAFDPFDIIYWAVNDQYLINDISGSGTNDFLIVLDNAGNIQGQIATGFAFPEQIALAANGNILVATFSSPSGIYEFAPDGTLVGYYDVVSSCRGVYELPNGNLLVTSGGGVYEISKNNVLVDTKISSTSMNFRFIEFVSPPTGGGVLVKFRVDMSQQIIPAEGVHIAGNFQNWDPGATIMSDSGDDIYTYTQYFNPGDSLQFKYINGDEWGEDETVPPECAFDNNRLLIVPESDTTLVAVCFGSCEPCGNPVPVTFQVDMSQQTISPDGVHIAGSFQGWNPGATEMTTLNDSIFTYTQIFTEGSYIEFKFINGDEWGEDETVPAECAQNNNRFLNVPGSDTTLMAVCFGSCDPCEIVADTVKVTFRVDMSEQMVSGDGIHLAGSFQGWDPATTEMTLFGNNLYEIELTLDQTEYYEFVFINGNTWEGQESVPPACGVDNGNGGFNRYITAPVSDTTLMDVCFSSCEPCDVGIRDFNYDVSELKVFPNPFTGKLNVEFQAPEQGQLILALTDPIGRELQIYESLSVVKGHNTFLLRMEEYLPGIYFIRAKFMYSDQVTNQMVKIVKKI
ncbi:MAG: hypothetical protein K9G76_09865 [Bacteroidales bacterium]|nr:hypothetical protein [Bacteroidales bacterium]MCF8404005.1 hypothetical protein [Bacteroidales bacterium]